MLYVLFQSRHLLLTKLYSHHEKVLNGWISQETDVQAVWNLRRMSYFHVFVIIGLRMGEIMHHRCNYLEHVNRKEINQPCMLISLTL
jgi:hypothetical protein